MNAYERITRCRQAREQCLKDALWFSARNHKLFARMMVWFARIWYKREQRWWKLLERKY